MPTRPWSADGSSKAEPRQNESCSLAVLVKPLLFCIVSFYPRLCFAYVGILVKDHGRSGTGRRANDVPLRPSNDAPLHPSDEKALRESLNAIVAKLGEHEALLDRLKLGANEDHAAPPRSPSGRHLRLAWSRPEPPVGAPVSYANGVEQAHFRAEQTTPPHEVPHPNYTESPFQQGPEHPPAIDEAYLPGQPIARPDRVSQMERVHRGARRRSGASGLDPSPALEQASQTSIRANKGRLKPNPRSARALRYGMAAAIAVFVSLATAAGIFLMPGKTERDKLPGERLSLEEFESRQRAAAADDPAPQAPANDIPTASNLSQRDARADDMGAHPPPLSRGESKGTGTVGVAGAPAEEGRQRSLGTQGEAERLSDKAPVAREPDVSHKLDGRLVGQGAGIGPQPQFPGASEAMPADARDVSRPSTGNEAQTVTGSHSEPDVQAANLIPLPARKPKLSPPPRKSEGAGRGNDTSRTAAAGQSSASRTRYVPALILVKNPAAALEVYAQVRKRHPALLGAKTAAVKPVTMENKETWYRVVLNPAGTKDAARSVCQKLGAEGAALGCSVLPE